MLYETERERGRRRGRNGSGNGNGNGNDGSMERFGPLRLLKLGDGWFIHLLTGFVSACDCLSSPRPRKEEEEESGSGGGNGGGGPRSSPKHSR
jgi:hypothetical protein